MAADFSQFMDSEMGILALIGILLLLILALAVSLFISFLPFIVALLRKHPQKVPIFLLNLLLGWTGIGWVVALIWAFIKNEKTTG